MPSLSFLKNRYFLTGLVFLVWMCFLDRDDLFSRFTLDKKLADVEKQKDYYEKEILKIKEGLNDLQTDPYKLEKFARERYYMKKEDEDLYVLLPTPSVKKENSLINKLRSIFEPPIPSSAKQLNHPK